MPNYAIINFKNIESIASIRAIQAEALREREYSNVISENSKYNEILLGDGNYLKLINTALRSDYYTTPDKKGRLHKEPRIKAISVVMTYSNAAAIDEDPEMFERWKKKNLEYLEKTFPGCPKSCVLHFSDEATPHIHGFIVPQQENGKIAKTKFLNGRLDYYKHQEEYPKFMEEFGLQRGEHRPPRQADLFEKEELQEYRALNKRIRALNRTIKSKESYIKQLIEESELKQMGIKEYTNKIKELKNELEKHYEEKAREILGRVFDKKTAEPNQANER